MLRLAPDLLSTSPSARPLIHARRGAACATGNVSSAAWSIHVAMREVSQSRSCRSVSRSSSCSSVST
eukprot:6322550-Pyramimonas_sp.AAC.1